MLIYCAWCERFQGATAARGHQLHLDYCEIDSSTICPDCRDKYVRGTAELTVELPAMIPAEHARTEH